MLVEQDAVSEEIESGAAVHLQLDHLRLGVVHALGPAVVKRQGEGRGDGQRVKFQAP
jgi:hypothetical protein